MLAVISAGLNYLHRSPSRPHIPLIRFIFTPPPSSHKMNTPASRRSAGSVSFASAPAEQSAVSSATLPPSPSENNTPAAPHRGDRIAGPSILSTDPYAARHIEDALCRRAVNSPPLSPLHRPLRPPSLSASTPTAQRLHFPPDRAAAPSLGDDDELSDDGLVHIDSELVEGFPVGFLFLLERGHLLLLRKVIFQFGRLVDPALVGLAEASHLAL